MKSNQSVFILGIHLLIILAFAIMAVWAPLGDWGNYYYGSKAYLMGYGNEIYNPTFFNDFVSHQGQHNFFLSYTQVPPLSLLVYLPISFLKVGTAKFVWSILTGFFCCFSFSRLFTFFKIDLRWSLILPLLLFIPLRSDIYQGQSYLLLTALLAEGWMARKKGKWILAAFCFAFAIQFKLFPVIILIWLLLERDWKMLISTSCFVLLLFGASLFFVHWDTWQFYLSEILPRLIKGEITNTYSTSYQSMQVFLKQLFVPDALHNQNYVLDKPLYYLIGTKLWLGIVLVIAALFSNEKKYNSFFRFSIWIFAGLLISGYGSSYGLLQLIFLSIAIIATREISTRKKIILLALIGILVNIPVQWFLNFSIPFSFPRLFFILIFLGVLIYFFRPQWNRSAFISLGIIFILFSLFTLRLHIDENNYLLREEPSLLITDFAIKGNTIKYNFRNQQGMNTASVTYSEPISDSKVLKYDAHCIYFNEGDIKFPNERVSNAILINDSTLLYLSDKNRGVGFYTIREMKIR